MKVKLFRIAGELRKVAGQIETKANAGTFTSDELAELGALLLDAGATIAHELKFSRECFAGLARSAWRSSQPRRRPN